MNACLARGNLLGVKTLLDFGAIPDSSAADGRTPLHITARKDNHELTQILLESGANINIESKHRETALTVAITYNSHNTLKLLLDRWFEYSECPRLKGPNLLSLVAMYADIQTVTMLTETDHLRLKYDYSYSSDDHINQLLARSEDERLLQAFKGLLAVMHEQTHIDTSADSMLESGRRPKGGIENKSQMPGSWKEAEKDDDEEEWSEWGDEVFEDALTTILHLNET